MSAHGGAGTPGAGAEAAARTSGSAQAGVASSTGTGTAASVRTSLVGSARRVVEQAWPVFVGQVSVVAFSTVDTVLLGRQSAAELAALSVGQAAYITVFIGLMGVLLAIGPIAGRLYGAGRHADAGAQLHQTVWLALGLAVIGSLALLFPEPFLRTARLSGEQEARVRHYLLVLALSLPASLLFTCYRGFNVAVSRAKAVMVLQVCGFALKIPLSLLLVRGAPALGLPGLGVVGAASATALVMWAQVLLAWLVLRRDPFYAPFQLFGRGLARPDRASLRALVKLGGPMGMGILIEVSAFALMAVFIARLGTTSVAAHQIVMNLLSIIFMLPMSLATALTTLVAQRIGAQDLRDARRLTRHGIGFGIAVALVLGTTVWLAAEPIVRLYTTDAAVVATAVLLLAWLPFFHTVDATQTLAAFVLRAYHVTTLPMFVFAASMWGVGLGGGYALAFNATGHVPPRLQGAAGYWAACTAGVALAALLLIALLVRVMRDPKWRVPRAANPVPPEAAPAG